jgi:FKBP-type peptidyl-prolyl cis-trans isomerase SlyD
MRSSTNLIIPQLVVVLLASVVFAAQPKRQPVSKIQPNSVVTLECAFFNEETISDISPITTRLVYTHGKRELPLRIEEELLGLTAGSQTSVHLRPHEAFGPVFSTAFREVPKEKIPPEGWKVGTFLQTKVSEDRVISMRVHEVRDKTVILDFNHPLAGKSIILRMKVVEVKNRN